MIYYFHYDTALGQILLAEENGMLVQASLMGKEPKQAEKKRTQTLDKAAKELAEYLAGKRKYFDLPLNPQGTDFQKKVWNALCEIPYGTTSTYKEIAQEAGNEKACRASGMANNKNPLVIFIPCHRVIGADGSLTGYACGLDIKQRLLDLEKTHNHPPKAPTYEQRITPKAGETKN